ncbi:MAG: protein-L-isoaspartate(D-aspartate) O-methyltransferase [Paludibacteraceae bacterium]|nr:protein-L-isoaspartate(D-aspartate) O-methyltransferase [Paludibacteraceae bacterium]
MKTIEDLRWEALRRNLVEVLKTKKITDVNVLNAINAVPRHKFMDSTLIEYSYEDKAFPIFAKQTISQPYTVALQTQLLDVKPGEKVLEIGTGSGYQTAVLCTLGANVYTIERQELLYEITHSLLQKLGYNAQCFLDDGFKGLSKEAPFDKIIITACSSVLPTELLKQLSIGGKMVIPYQDKNQQIMLRITRVTEKDFSTENFGKCAFVPMLKGIEKK